MKTDIVTFPNVIYTRGSDESVSLILIRRYLKKIYPLVHICKIIDYGDFFCSNIFFAYHSDAS